LTCDIEATLGEQLDLAADREAENERLRGLLSEALVGLPCMCVDETETVCVRCRALKELGQA